MTIGEMTDEIEKLEQERRDNRDEILSAILNEIEKRVCDADL